MWVVLRRTKFVLQDRKSLSPLSTYSSCKLHISGHDGNSFCMDSTQVRVFKQAYQISFCCFLQTFYCHCLDSQIIPETSHNFIHDSLEWSPSNQQVCRLLVSPDLSQCNSSRSKPSLLLHLTWWWLMWSLHSNIL